MPSSISETPVSPPPPQGDAATATPWVDWLWSANAQGIITHCAAAHDAPAANPPPLQTRLALWEQPHVAWGQAQADGLQACLPQAQTLRNLWGVWTPPGMPALNLVLCGSRHKPPADGWYGSITTSAAQDGPAPPRLPLPTPPQRPPSSTDTSAPAGLEAEFRDALARDELRLFFQPVVNMHGSPVGAEALVRWQHPRRGLLSPFHFMDMAEASGLIIPMGWWVLRAACQQLIEWARVPYKAAWTVAVNVSSKQFLQDNFVDEVQRILRETGINPRRLKLEVTESVMMQQVEEAIAKMSVLQAQGIKFSLDDFGTGYSSLSYLKRLPLQQLKIDQSFVRDIHKDPNSAAIVKTILALAYTMELSVVAEGVETLEQEEFLIAAGCRYLQGYLYGRPIPISQWA
ncbi:MAG: hypothetical protein RLZZ352_277 [Pseudomonadota bacterium]|jgi:EAL domain-containing protein (putative c-di-GMP-specific phosphodiesterase class I)